MEIHNRILALLDDAGAAYEVHSHEPVVSVQDARERTPHLVEGLVKTIVFNTAPSAEPPAWVLAAVPAADNVSYKLLAAAAGCSRKRLRLVGGDRVQEELGFEVGGVGPFPVQDGVRVFLDSAIADMDSIICGAGVRNRSLALNAAALIAVSGGELVSLVMREDEA